MTVIARSSFKWILGGLVLILCVIAMTTRFRQGGRTEIIALNSIGNEIHKVYDNDGVLEHINYVTNASSAPSTIKIYDIYSGIDQRWRFFSLRKHFFNEGDLIGEKGHAYLIEACAVCHSQSGQGRIETVAPSLAGMPEWYLNKQMAMFIDGRRKALPEEGPGHSYGDLMIRFLRDIEPAELKRLATYYSKLTPFKIKDQFGGDAKKGRVIYRGRGACINCHLEDGNGKKSAGAPPITIIPDWYFLRQMKAFREGYRGAHTKEEIINCMVVAASRLNEEDCKDLVAYLEELAGNK
jgi:cytochrome c553